MQIWPSPGDRTPSQTAFWVERAGGGIARTTPVSESQEAVERRLEADFPLYRLSNFGKNVLNRVSRKSTDEV